jgi:hypothetical protein
MEEQKIEQVRMKQRMNNEIEMSSLDSDINEYD